MIDFELLKDKYSFRKDLNNSANEIKTGNSELDFLFESFGGITLDKGIFKTHNFETSKKWTEIVIQAFPKYKNKMKIFGFDWYGRQYGKDLEKNFTYMFDIATGDDYELKQELSEFFNIDLIQYAEETLNISQFKKWNSENLDLDFNSIVSFKIPLWLGGKDEIENYEIADAEVNWEINRQLMNK